MTTWGSGRAWRRLRAPVSGWIALAAGVAAATAWVGRERETATLQEVGAEPGSPVLLYLAQPADCLGAGSGLGAWNGLAREEAVRVIGVLVGPGAVADADSLAADLGLRFPLRQDLAPRAIRLARRLGHSRTPVTILLDGRGRPALVLPSEAHAAPPALLEAAVEARLRALETRRPAGGALAWGGRP